MLHAGLIVVSTTNAIGLADYGQVQALIPDFASVVIDVDPGGTSAAPCDLRIRGTEPEAEVVAQVRPAAEGPRHHRGLIVTAKRRRQGHQRAFGFTRGVRIAGTNIACDALGAAGELVFLSHAQALGALGRRLPLRAERPPGAAGHRGDAGAAGVVGGAPAPARAAGAVRAPVRPGRRTGRAVPVGPPARGGLAAGRGGRQAGDLRGHGAHRGAGVRGARGRGAQAPTPSASTAPSATPASACRRRPRRWTACWPSSSETLAAGGAPVLLTPPFGTAMDAAAALAAGGAGPARAPIDRGRRGRLTRPRGRRRRPSRASPASWARARRCCGRPRPGRAPQLAQLARTAVRVRLGVQPGSRRRWPRWAPTRPSRCPTSQGEPSCWVTWRPQARARWPCTGATPRRWRRRCGRRACSPMPWARPDSWNCSGVEGPEHHFDDRGECHSRRDTR